MKILEIENAKAELATMKSAFTYVSKDDPRYPKMVKRYNAFVALVNASEKLIDQSFGKEIVDLMILHRFEMEYNKEMSAGDLGGFISEAAVSVINQMIAIDVTMGYEVFRNKLAAQMAGDMLGNATFLTDEEKESDVLTHPKVKVMFGDAVVFWRENLDKIVAKVYQRRGVWI